MTVFANGKYADVSLARWTANTSVQIVADHLNLNEDPLRALPQTKTPVVPT